MDPKTGLLAKEEPSREELEKLLEILRRVKGTTLFDFLYYILADETLMFLDMFSGDTLKIPQRDEVLKLMDYARIWVFVKNNENDPEVVRKAAARFKRRTQSIQRIVAKVDEMTGGSK